MQWTLCVFFLIVQFFGSLELEWFLEFGDWGGVGPSKALSVDNDETGFPTTRLVAHARNL